MSTQQLLPFFLVSIGLIIVPGPNVLVIVSTGIAHGRIRGLQTVAGTTLAMSIQLAVAAVGTAWFVQHLADGFFILKWLGVAYLLYLGFQQLKRCLLSPEIPIKPNASSTFMRGFLVSLTNPKTIVFFSAFLPQFVSPDGDYQRQIAILSVLFLILAAFFDSVYAIASARLRPLLEQRRLARARHGISGLLLLGSGAWLASLRRVQ